ncbi:MAG: hypothetical protein RLY21_365 [Planctomycetota bacterium]
MSLFISTVAATCIAASALAPTKDLPKPTEGVSLTVYSSADPAGFNPQQFIQQQRMSGMDNVWGVPGYGVVKVVRKVAVPKGVGTLAFTDVAAWIDPTTVSFTDLDDPSTSVLEQNFQFDLVSPAKLMERYIGREITVAVTMGDGVSNVTGELLSANMGQLVLKTKDGVRIVPAGGQVQLGELPGGLLTKPTLMWKLASEKGGDHLVRTTYQTNGMTWRADYNIVIDGEDKTGGISAWVTLMNLSGASFPNAELKLVAGDVQKVEAQRFTGRAVRMEAMAMADASGFQEKAFADFHLYTLPRRTDVAQNSTQQIALFPTVDSFKLKRELVFNFTADVGGWGQPQTDRDFFGNTMQGKPSIFVTFENKEDNSLGMPLPAGKIRCYKMDDADGTLEFIGEDIIGHTPRNETVKVKLGQAFDVVGERTRTDFTIDNAAKRMTESFKIEIRNQKAVGQKVRVIERQYRWTNWKITSNNQPFTKVDSDNIAFDVVVNAEGKAEINYTVTYNW